MAQDAAQRRGKGQPDLGLDLKLHDARQLILDGIFNGDDLDGFFVQCVQTGVQRGGLAASGRSGEEDDAVRLLHQGAQDLEVIRQKPQVFQRDEHLHGQDADDHILPVEARDDRDAQIDLLVLDFDDRPAILREAPLHDVELGDDLDPGDDRRLEVARLLRHALVIEDPIHAIAHADAIAEGLDVDIRGARGDRLGEDLIDQRDHRGRISGFLHVFNLLEADRLALLGLFGAHRLARQDLLDRLRSNPVGASDRQQDLLFRRQDPLDRIPQVQLQIFRHPNR